MSIRKVFMTLDIRKAESQTTIEGLHVGDVGSTQLVVTLNDGTRAIDLTKYDIVTAIIHGKKPDGYEIHNECDTTTEPGKIIYTLTAQDTAAVGTVDYQIDVQISEEERCFSPRFRSRVSGRVYEPVFRLLDSEPEDWAQNYAKYYKKVDGVYVKNNDPTYAADTFYVLVDPPVESASEFLAFWSAYNKTLGVFSEVVEARREFGSLSERLENTAAPTDDQVAEAVGDYLDDNKSVIVDKAIIENTEMLSPDVTFNVENDDVADYLSKDDYDFTKNNVPHDNAYDGDDYLSGNNSKKSTFIKDPIDSTVNERPNGGEITIPAGGVNITLYDTANKTKWSESITGDTYTVKNLIPNRIYTYTIKNSSGEIIKSGSCKASGQVRFIDAGKATTYPVSDPTQVYQRPLFNIRDLGGWACDGGHIKYGLVYRGCRLNGNYTNDQPERFGISLTPAQIDFFKNFLGIRDEIDFRQLKNDPDTGNTETAGDDAVYETADDIEDTALGIGVDYTIIPLNPYIKGIEIKSSNADMNRRYANVIKRIARDISDKKPCYIHCLEGADRTGTVTMLILAICGVSRSDIERDYELTSFSKDYAGNRNRRARNDAAQNHRWMTLIQYLLGSSFTGATFRDKIIDYVLKIGVTIEEINTIRAGLIDGAPEKIKNPNSDVSVTYSLTNINTDNPISSIAMYQPFEATLTALNMKEIQSVTVLMGNTDITSTAYIQEKISIPRVTGNISITASASDVDIYSKPSGGIPKTDLSSSVQTSLSKADSALQAHQDISGKENTANKKTAISSQSQTGDADTNYPTVGAVRGFVTYKLDDLQDYMEDYVDEALGGIENGSY